MNCAQQNGSEESSVSQLPQKMEGWKTMEMRTCGWMIWMAMAMNVVEADQEDDVHHTQVDVSKVGLLHLWIWISLCFSCFLLLRTLDL
jgi:hypothetical protein